MEIFEYLLKQKLEHKIGAPVDLIITDNIRSMINIKPEGSRFSIRLHHMFLDADEPVLDDLALFARTGKSSLLQKFIDKNTDLIGKKEEKKKRKSWIKTKGIYHDLKQIFFKVNWDYFRGRAGSSITWGKKRYGRNRRSIEFGSYHHEADLIRINPKLDSPRVPRYFISFIVYHEMLHSMLEQTNDYKHSKDFRKKEKEFRDYTKAIAWQKKNLDLFIR
jgi:predicted SprT family Zn-dependent metalloprotease